MNKMVLGIRPESLAKTETLMVLFFRSTVRERLFGLLEAILRDQVKMVRVEAHRRGEFDPSPTIVVTFDREIDESVMNFVTNRIIREYPDDLRGR